MPFWKIVNFRKESKKFNNHAIQSTIIDFYMIELTNCNQNSSKLWAVWSSGCLWVDFKNHRFLLQIAKCNLVKWPVCKKVKSKSKVWGWLGHIFVCTSSYDQFWYMRVVLRPCFDPPKQKLPIGNFLAKSCQLATFGKLSLSFIPKI